MFKKVLSTIFLVSGLLLTAQGLFDISKRLGYYNLVTKSSTIYNIPSSLTFQNIPSKISIKSLALTLPVESTEIKNGYWPTSQTGVSFLANSGNLGNKGNLIFYGHNWKNLLGNLHKVKTGDTLVVSGQNGQDFLYSIAYIATVNADDVSILADTNDERITLYTCTGFLDQKRLVVVAKRV